MGCERYALVASARLICFADAAPRVPRPCANCATRSSCSIQCTCRRRGAAAAGAILRLELVDRVHPVAVGGDRVGQALEAARRGAQVAHDVGQAVAAGGGDEAGVDEAAELAGDVEPRGLQRGVGR